MLDLYLVYLKTLNEQMNTEEIPSVLLEPTQ